MNAAAPGGAPQRRINYLKKNLPAPPGLEEPDGSEKFIRTSMMRREDFSRHSEFNASKRP
jgi:hypothetical protein